MAADAKVWVVTGASRGIGAAIATVAAEAGHRVAMVARGESVLSAAQALGEMATGFQCDVADSEAVNATVDQIIEHYGRIDVVVNNAGVHRGGKVHRLTDEAWQEVLQVNLTGAMSMTRATLPHMDAGGAVVNVGAVVGFRGFPGDSAYASSKAGLSGLTKALAIELAPKGITANLVIPGLVLTEMTAELSETALEKMTQQIPMRRFAGDHEIAEVVYWVAQSRYMTGACVPVDGGLLSSFGVV
ncbi:MAG: beta-ketoacyl-ACP reductase [Halieaceae bacterium]|nr:MAG: beta-ketoacyl-ACP reductase [Halieaceae bacterium]